MTTRQHAAGILESIAQLLEFRGENTFKVRAFQNAARALETVTDELSALAAEPGRLEAIPGIGKSIASVIREIAETGTTTALAELEEGAPPGLQDLLSVPNLGPKKVRVLHDELGVTDLASLETAVRSGKVAELKGFGAKSADRILASLAQRSQYAGQTLAIRARRVAGAVLAHLAAHHAVIRCEIAGSLRRGKETVKDIDLLAASSDPAAVMDAFVALDVVQSVTGRGATKASVILEGGISADLRVVADAEFAAALAYFTGSLEHNTRMRARAKRRGLRLNEYGLFPEGSETSLPLPNEAALYEHLGLPYIDPELREDLGEFEAAEAGQLPHLVTLADYRGVLHCHSTWSDGAASLRDMALAARDDWGLSYYGTGDHSEVAAYARGVRRDALPRLYDEIAALNAELGPGFRVLRGTECDILPDGSLDYTPEILEEMDYVVGSVHSRLQMPAGEMTARLLRAVRQPHLTILGHPTGRLLLAREPYPFDMETVLQECARTRTIVEINGDPNRLDLDWRHVRRARELGCLFAVNPDAHSTAGLAHIEEGLRIARKGGLEARDVVNCLPTGAFLELSAGIRRHKAALAV